MTLIAAAKTTNCFWAVVYWTLKGAIDLEQLAEVWELEGLDPEELPGAPSPDRVLKQTLARWATPRRIVRPLEKNIRGYGLINEVAHGEQLDHSVELVTTLRDSETGPVVTVLPEAHELAGPILAHFTEGLGQIDARVISTWLTSLAQSLLGVSLAPRKGFYFLPQKALEYWRAYAGAIEDVSDHHFFEIPTAPAEGAVLAVTEALTAEVNSLVEDITDELLEGEELGRRALRTRVGLLEALLGKIGTYEELLDRQLDTVRDRIGALRGSLAETILSAPEDE